MVLKSENESKVPRKLKLNLLNPRKKNLRKRKLKKKKLRKKGSNSQKPKRNSQS